MTRLLLVIACATLLTPAGSAAQATRAAGYRQDRQGANLTLRLFVVEGGSTSRHVEFATFRVSVPSGTKLTSISELIPKAEFARACAEASWSGRGTPELRFFGTTRVLRGAAKSVVAESTRPLVWPDGFQLATGDIIEIREFLL